MTGAAMTKRICYFTNVYPAPSHTTMRREIHAIERLGTQVTRVAARRFAGPLVEPADRAEAQCTAYTTQSVFRAFGCVVWVMLARPARLARALRDAAVVGSTSRPGVWKYLMYIGEACVLLRLARGSEHIHANFGNATGIAVMCRVLGGPPVSLRIHGPEEFESFSAAEWDWKARHAAFVAPISEHGAGRVREAIGASHHGKVKTLKCGVDHSALGRVAALPKALRLVCVARLEQRKGHAVLFEAVAALRGRGLAVTLQLVGDGALRANLQGLARDLSLGEAVEFTGWCDGAGVLQALRRARVLVLPSLAEGLPIVLMEALAAGRAVVATDVAGIAELVVPGRSGWLVPAGDALGLAAALQEALLSSDAKLLSLAMTGRDMVAEHHDVDCLMRDLLGRIRAG